MLPVSDEGELRLDLLDGFENVKVVASGLVSNSVGTINDVTRIAAWAHEHGAIHVCDAAQGAPHRRIDVQTLGTDFLAVSGHKLCGPSGIGFLWGRTDLLLAMEPFLMGGHMIRKVTGETTTWGELPAKFEAGTAPMAEAVGLGAAIDYIEAVGLEAIEHHEQALAAYALEQLGELPGLTLYGPPPERRAGIVSFNVADVHPHDVAQILDQDAIAIRAGHHCTQPLMRRFDVPATNRASFYLYNTQDDVDRLVASVRRVIEIHR
jgi:cysteine desulfurase/selenocysteine lyase